MPERGMAGPGNGIRRVLHLCCSIPNVRRRTHSGAREIVARGDCIIAPERTRQVGSGTAFRVTRIDQSAIAERSPPTGSTMRSIPATSSPCLSRRPTNPPHSGPWLAAWSWVPVTSTGMTCRGMAGC